jgi:hypothetical protein
MSRFKDRLWSDLVRAHGAELSQLSRPRARSRRRPRMLAGTGVGLSAAGTAAALLVGAAGTSPAFAVTKNNDGSVTVEIGRIAAIPGANAKLRALGYRAQVVQMRAACAPGHRGWTIQGLPKAGQVRGPANARFDPGQIPAGKVVVIPAWRRGRRIEIRPPRLIPGQVPPCLPLGPPPGVLPRQVPGPPCAPGLAPARSGHGQQRPSRHQWNPGAGNPGAPPNQVVPGPGRPRPQVAVQCPAPPCVQGLPGSQHRPHGHR